MPEQGIILKGVGGFYTVRTENGEMVVCNARGRFRQEGTTPLIGDKVLVERQQEGHAAIADILPRKNALVRPAVANIDQLVIVLSASKPKADLLLCDKLILAAYPFQIEPLILCNKSDTSKDGEAEAIVSQYAPFYQTMVVSAHTGAGLACIKAALSGKISCLAGQSAVGKSSLLNALLPGLSLPVGGLAKKTARGKHTTRHVELISIGNGAVLDTPGFSLLEPELMDQQMLNNAYREFQGAAKNCRFSACAHKSEPDCAVKALVASGQLHKERYARYLELSEQFEQRRKRIYD